MRDMQVPHTSLGWDLSKQAHQQPTQGKPAWRSDHQQIALCEVPAEIDARDRLLMCRASARFAQSGAQLSVHGRRLQSGQARQLEQGPGAGLEARLGYSTPRHHQPHVPGPALLFERSSRHIAGSVHCKCMQIKQGPPLYLCNCHCLLQSYTAMLLPALLPLTAS